MTTTTLHADVQRSRFMHHVLSALSGLSQSMRAVPPQADDAATSASLEAQKVRTLAHSYSKTDPGFAADLYAAAARHEGLSEH